jgi:BlaI family penicillinase repressor
LKNSNFKISNAEWLVMKVLWNESPQTTTRIIEALSEEADWKSKTIHTLIARLVKKGALGVDKNSGQHTFYPLITREECIQEETGSFVQKIYEGSIYNLVANFIHDEKMSVKEMEDLKKLLDDKLN